MQWMTRGGEAIGSQRAHSIDLAKGKAFYTYVDTCHRCGGAGGSDAWAHTGWTCHRCNGGGKELPCTKPLFTAERLAKLNATRDKQRAKKAEKAQVAEEARRAEILAEWTPWVESNAQLLSDIRRHAEASDFMSSLIGQVDSLRILSESQMSAAERFLAEARKREMARIQALSTGWVGVIGERIEMTLTVEKILNWTNYDSYPIILKYFHICKDAQGNVVTYTGGAKAMPAEGETATIKAKVEEHKTREGVKQTVISRPALSKQPESCQ